MRQSPNFTSKLYVNYDTEHNKNPSCAVMLKSKKSPRKSKSQKSQRRIQKRIQKSKRRSKRSKRSKRRTQKKLKVEEVNN